MPRIRTKTLSLLLLALGLAAGLEAQSNYPNVTYPPENLYSASKEILGKILFWDEQLSSTNTMACGTCHIPSAGGSDPRSAGLGSNHPGPDGILGTFDDFIGSRGVIRALDGGKMIDDGTFFPEVQRTGRKAPSMIDAAFFTDLFWDGRATSKFTNPVTGVVEIQTGGALESQAVGPPVSNVEMAHESRSWAQIVAKLEKVKPLRLASNLPADIAAALSANPSYPALFQAAFGDPAIDVKRIAFAIGTYERSLVADQTPFDLGTLTAQQANGLAIFNGIGNCNVCHPAPFFSDDAFHALGVQGQDVTFDSGRAAITGLATDAGKVKTPSLRNVGLREQFAGNLFHNGSSSGQDLDQIIQFYRLGGNQVSLPFTDPNLVAVLLTQSEITDLVEFLRNGLTDPRVANETGPFSRPTLRSESGAMNPLIIPGSGFADSMGNIPRIIADQPANLQHPFFTIGVADAWGGMGAYLVAGSPNTMFETLFGFIPLAVGSGPMLPFIDQITLEGTMGSYGTGYGSVTRGIADNPYWIGKTFFTQWIVLDPVSLVDPVSKQSIPGFGISLSDVAIITVLP
ncbi:MAG: hypothetical protein H6807_03620 [Planctomycetes bacterium]|nr:hypothetical protein [Planctomycetota bacterium]